ncbi:MAG: hypothetical protein FWG64_09295 [Firmicutes bacterium]|nr:hypothetical protein [Bacillota bacterium]
MEKVDFDEFIEDWDTFEEDNLITRDEFVRNLNNSYKNFLKRLQSGEPIKGNALEKVDEWIKMAEELDNE